ncbi:hypothetical protein [Paracoccus aestuariivivens]|uniref:Hedgehog/Intein (Hint) domain-containing protein n=1 Tax=Paracoccus aestuariivivens TaxID=1820333 RepID=A0A6L6JE26_9RHOB|nr:hypothetical protein [Paracoccus aestuariivivens]MTH78989.1 hypothetical protein [Paracoccus aestuariivivens]
MIHLALARHEILLAGGAPMESSYTGPMTLRALSHLHRLAPMMAYPALASVVNPVKPARPLSGTRTTAES